MDLNVAHKRPYYILLWIVLVVSSALYITKAVADPDLWWHITVGQWILHNLDVPTTDHWNMFAEDAPWLAYSWLIEVLFAALDKCWGAHGLIMLQVLVGVLFSGSLFYCLGKISGSSFIGALLGCYAALSCFNHFTLRPQIFVWIYLVWALYIAWLVEVKGRLIWREALVLVLVMALWANSHITAALGIAAVFLWLLTKNRLVLGLKCAAAAFLGTLLTPYAGKEWLTFFSKTGHPFAFQGILEFAPATIDQTAVGMLLFGVCTLLLLLHLKPNNAQLGKLFGFSAFLISALAVIKFLPFAVIQTAAIIAWLWGREQKPEITYGNFGEALVRLQRAASPLYAVIGAVLLCVFCVAKTALLWKNPVNNERLGVEAFNFVAEKKLPEPALVPFDFGGYLMYRLSDGNGNVRYKVSIDGRTNITPKGVWDEFMDAYKGRAPWRRYLKRVNPGTIIWRSQSALVSLLIASGEWCLVHKSSKADDEVAVFVSKDYFEARAGELTSDNCHAKSRNSV